MERQINEGLGEIMTFIKFCPRCGCKMVYIQSKREWVCPRCEYEKELQLH